MFSQVCKTSAIPENSLHFMIILEGAFGFLGSLLLPLFLTILYFFFRWRGERSMIWSFSVSSKFPFGSPQAWLRTASWNYLLSFWLVAWRIGTKDRRRMIGSWQKILRQEKSDIYPLNETRATSTFAKKKCIIYPNPTKRCTIVSYSATPTR
jgi:hypothetical protein